MVAQNEQIVPNDSITSSGAFIAIIDYSIGGTGAPGGTTYANCGDSSDNTGMNMSAPAWILWAMSDGAIGDNDLVDFVRIHARWSTNGPGLHFSLHISVNGLEYPSVPGGSGPGGDTWIGTHTSLAERVGIIHPFAPSGSPWSVTAWRAVRMRPENWGDSNAAIALRDVWLEGVYFRQPTVSALTISGAVTELSGRILDWTYVGDKVASAFEVYVYDHSATPGSSGFLSHTSGGSGSSHTLPARTSDGTYYVYIRQALTGTQSNQKCWSTWKSKTYIIDRGPIPPILLAPADGTSFDISQTGWKSTWQFKHPNTSETQSAWALRRLANLPGAVYEWFRVSDRTWQVASTYNPGSVTEVSWLLNEWATGRTYSWSVSTKDSDGDASPYAPSFILEGNAPPTVVVNTPTGSITNTSSPPIGITFSDIDGDPMEMYEAKVYRASEYGQSGFTPDDTAFFPEWESGQIVSSTLSIGMGVSLENVITYRAYVRVRAGGSWSQWAFKQFTLNIVPPPTPTISVTPDHNGGVNLISVTSVDGLFIDVEYSDDGVKWEPIRFGKGLAPSGGNVTVVDRECPARFPRRYRAKAWDNI